MSLQGGSPYYLTFLFLVELKKNCILGQISHRVLHIVQAIKNQDFFNRYYADCWISFSLISFTSDRKDLKFVMLFLVNFKCDGIKGSKLFSVFKKKSPTVLSQQIGLFMSFRTDNFGLVKFLMLKILPTRSVM